MEKWEIQPPLSKKTEPIVTKIVQDDAFLNLYPCAKFHYDTVKSFCSATLVGCKVTRVVFWGVLATPYSQAPAPTTLYRILRSVRQMTSFRRGMYPLGSSFSFSFSLLRVTVNAEAGMTVHSQGWGLIQLWPSARFNPRCIQISLWVGSVWLCQRQVWVV